MSEPATEATEQPQTFSRGPDILICIGCNVAGAPNMPVLALQTDTLPPALWPRAAATFLEQHMQWAQTRLAVACGLPEGDPVQDAVLAVCATAASSAAIGQHTAGKSAQQWGRNFISAVARRVPFLTSASGALTGETVFVCGAGPSLEAALPHMRELATRGLFFAVSGAAPALLDHGVMPDAIFCCEAKDLSRSYQMVADHPMRSQFPSLHALDYVCNPLNWEPEADGYVGMASHESNFSPYVRTLGGIPIAYTGSVSCAATSAAITLGASTVVLLGQDLGYPGDRMYSKGSMFEDITVTRTDGGTMMFGGHSKHVQEVARVPTKVVRYWTESDPEPIDTDVPFDSFRRWFSNAGSTRTIINASEGGSHVPGTVALTVQDVIDSFEPRTHMARIPKLEYVPTEAAVSVLDSMQEQAELHLATGAMLAAHTFPMLNMFTVGATIATANTQCSQAQRFEMLRKASREGSEAVLECVAEAREQLNT